MDHKSKNKNTNGKWRKNMTANDLDRTCGLTDDEMTERFKESIRIDNEIRKIKGLPIAKFDKERNKPYLEYPDGRREYVGE